MLLCKTNRVQREHTTERLTVEFDIQAEREITATFTFKPDPTISHISPLTSFQSGGRKITVEGTNFDIIDKPMMYYKNEMYRSNFSVSSYRFLLHLSSKQES